jgi:endonuclease-3
LDYIGQKLKIVKKPHKNSVNSFKEKSPKNLSALITLPGVGRKTANVVLANAFGVPAIVVDTHVRRIAYRLGLTEETQPEKIEKKLETLLPPQEWILCAHLLIEHGRHLCLARRPRCEQCPLLEYCPQKEPPRRPSSS